MNPASNKVYGPFWGELGWEIAQWAPFVNAASDGETDRIMCQPGHAALYGADIPISQSSPRPSDAVPDMLSCDGNRETLTGIIGQFKPERLKIKTRKGVPVIDGKLLPIPLRPHLFVPGGRQYVVFHCRAIPKCPERNMDGAKWSALTDLVRQAGLEPVVIGSASDYLPMGCDDKRDIPLESTIAWLRAAKVVVGASSGPMHLAQACEAPIVVWSGNAKKDKPRYEDVWNHFDSPTTFVSPSWSPGVGKIMKAIEAAL